MKVLKEGFDLKAYQKRLPLWQGFLIVLAMSVVITGLAFLLQPNTTLEVLALIKANPMLFVMNAMPVVVIALLLFCAFGNAFISSGLTSTLFLILSIVNRYKIEFRDEPLVPMDLMLVKEANGMMTEGGFKVSLLLVGAVVLFIILQFVLAYFIRQKSFKWRYRIPAVALAVLILVSGNNHYYAKAGTYNNFKVIGNQYNATKQFNSRGFIYSFIYNASAYKVEKPEGYKKEIVEKLIEDYAKSSGAKATSTNGKKKPHVIMVMGEAFSDFTNGTDLKFTNEEDPLRFYNTLIEQENTLSGHIIGPTFGGGTANTEYESLTGGANLYLNKSLTTAYTLIRKPTEALPSSLEKLGYSSVGMHPGYSWFYNRQNVYNNFGFQQSYFEDQFEQKKKGNYLAEDITVNKMIEVFEAHQKSNNNPLFEFCVTIQNHGPYDDAGHYGNEKVAFETQQPLSADGAKMLSTYLVGLRDADRQLERLITYFDAVNEPVVVVYFGDHLPYLGADYKVYRELGYDLSPNGNTTQRLNNYKTPFFIWKNTAASSIVDLNSIEMPENKVMNAGYLAGLVFEVIGEKNATPYMAFLNEMRTILPVFRGSEYSNGKENLDRLPKDSKEASYLKNLVYWQYYRMK